MQHINSDAEFQALTADKTKVYVIKFTASWCGPCKRISPVFEELAIKTAVSRPDIVFAEVDVDNADETADAAGTSGIPYFVAYVNGAMSPVTFTGAQEAGLRQWVAKIMALTS